MAIQWVALAGFVLVTTFTPGPNNISAMSLGISHGYRKSLGFLSGIAVGFFIVMCVCAIIASFLLKSFPFIEPYLRIAASLYIVWLAIHTFNGSLKTDSSISRPLRFHDGLLLQLLNPKVMVYGLTLYSSFLLDISGSLSLIILSAAALAAIGFISVSMWAYAGTSFGRMFRQQIVRRTVAAILSLLLLYSALESSGLITSTH